MKEPSLCINQSSWMRDCSFHFNNKSWLLCNMNDNKGFANHRGAKFFMVDWILVCLFVFFPSLLVSGIAHSWHTKEAANELLKEEDGERELRSNWSLGFILIQFNYPLEWSWNRCAGCLSKRTRTKRKRAWVRAGSPLSFDDPSNVRVRFCRSLNSGRLVIW